MRCLFCGWDGTPEGRDTCDKCGKPLQADSFSSSANVQERPTTRKPTGNVVVGKSTVRESGAANSAATVRDDQIECPICHYPMQNGECPQCGYPANTRDVEDPHARAAARSFHPSPELKKTERPIRKGEKEGAFMLTPISEETGRPEGEALVYEGNETYLNRDNTDPKNHTITSAEQAAVSHEDGLWFIEDHSELRTTFVQAARKVEIQDGDLILLGNQLYRFDRVKP